MSCKPTATTLAPMLVLVGRGLDAAGQLWRGLQPPGGHQFVEVRADEVTHHLAAGQVLQAGTARPRCCRPSPVKLVIWYCTGMVPVSRLTGGVRLPELSSAASIELCARLATRKLSSWSLPVCETVHSTICSDSCSASAPAGRPIVEALNLLGAVAIDPVDGPGPFQVCARPQGRAAGHRLAKVLQQTLLARVDEDQATGEHQHPGLGQHQPLERPLDEQAGKTRSPRP